MSSRGTRLVALALLAGAAFAAFPHVGPLLEAAGPHAPLLFTGVMALWVTLCLPAPVMLATAFALFPTRPLVALGCLVAGNTVAQAAGFLLARHFGRESIRRRFGSTSWFRWAEDQTRRRGAAAVLTMRLMPFFPNSPANWAFGLTEVPFWRYLGASLVGSLVPTAVTVFGAAGAMHVIRTPQFRQDLGMALAGVAVVAGSYLVARRRVARRPAEHHPLTGTEHAPRPQRVLRVPNRLHDEGLSIGEALQRVGPSTRRREPVLRS